MNKKVLLFSLLLLSGSLFSLSAQEESSRTLIIDEVEYGKPNQTYNTYKTTWKKNRFRDNWFITIGGGAQVLFDEDDSKADFQKRVTFAPQFSIGKYFSPIWGLRLNFTGGSLHGFNDGDSGTYRKWNHGSDHYQGAGFAGKPGYPSSTGPGFLTWDPQWNYMYSPEEIWDNVRQVGDNWEWYPVGAVKKDNKGTPIDANGNKMLYMQHIHYFQANVDFMFDLINLFGNYNPKRFFELTPYAGVGLYNAFSNLGSDNYMTIGVHAGLITKFRLGERVGLNIEFSGSMTSDEFDGQNGDNQNVSGIGQAIAGLNFKLGKTYWEVAEPMDYDLIDRLNDEINRLRNNVPVCPECPPPPPVQVVEKPAEIKFLPDPVFFRIDKSIIDPSEWAKIEKAVDYLNIHQDVNVVVTGYADKKTAYPEYNMKLSERRSKTVAQALTQKYGINPLRVSVNWSGDQIQPFKINEWNRVVIFVIE